MDRMFVISTMVEGVKAYVRYGENGGCIDGYCLYRGHIAAFKKRSTAESIIRTFDDPTKFSIEEFAKVS